MSTEHNGGYCPVRDKMMLTRSEAREMSKQGGFVPYLCTHCDMWHVHTNKGKKQRSGKSFVKRNFKP